MTHMLGNRTMRSAKIKLNKLGIDDVKARIVRLMLEVTTIENTIKSCQVVFLDMYRTKKLNTILEIEAHYKEQDWKYSVNKCTVGNDSHIISFVVDKQIVAFTYCPIETQKSNVPEDFNTNIATLGHIVSDILGDNDVNYQKSDADTKGHGV